MMGFINQVLKSGVLLMIMIIMGDGLGLLWFRNVSIGMGAIGLASDKRLEPDLLAASALIHAKAASLSNRGSSASAIAASLEELTNTLQKPFCGYGHAKLS